MLFSKFSQSRRLVFDQISPVQPISEYEERKKTASFNELLEVQTEKIYNLNLLIIARIKGSVKFLCPLLYYGHLSQTKKNKYMLSYLKEYFHYHFRLEDC